MDQRLLHGPGVDHLHRPEPDQKNIGTTAIITISQEPFRDKLFGVILETCGEGNTIEGPASEGASATPSSPRFQEQSMFKLFV